MSKGILSETLQSAYPVSVLLAGIYIASIQIDFTGVKNMNPFHQPTQSPQTTHTTVMSLIPIDLPDCSNIEKKFSNVSFFCSKREKVNP